MAVVRERALPDADPRLEPDPRLELEPRLEPEPRFEPEPRLAGCRGAPFLLEVVEGFAARDGDEPGRKLASSLEAPEPPAVFFHEFEKEGLQHVFDVGPRGAQHAADGLVPALLFPR